MTEIYNCYVSNTNITFDTEPCTVERGKDWFDRYSIAGLYRLWVAELDGAVLLSATSSEYRTHPAFKQTVEFGIYLDSDRKTHRQYPLARLRRRTSGCDARVSLVG